jgi:hypothetical protein
MEVMLLDQLHSTTVSALKVMVASTGTYRYRALNETTGEEQTLNANIDDSFNSKGPLDYYYIDVPEGSVQEFNENDLFQYDLNYCFWQDDECLSAEGATYVGGRFIFGVQNNLDTDSLVYTLELTCGSSDPGKDSTTGTTDNSDSSAHATYVSTWFIFRLVVVM